MPEGWCAFPGAVDMTNLHDPVRVSDSREPYGGLFQRGRYDNLDTRESTRFTSLVGPHPDIQKTNKNFPGGIRVNLSPVDM